MAKKNERDFNVFIYNNYNYKISYEELLELGDYYIDFKLMQKSTQAAQKCDSIELRDLINKHYSTAEISHRASAKIVYTDNPVLNKEGVPFFNKILSQDKR